MNPCPCGYMGDERGSCHCTPDAVKRYRRRVSGPLLDRLDLQLEVPRVTTRELAEMKRVGEASTVTAQRVRQARDTQLRRQGVSNGRLGLSEVTRHCTPDDRGRAVLELAVERLGLSARAYHRILRIARTIADLADAERASVEHVAEALSLRRPGHESLSRPT